jgi:hypothetical protein
LLTRPETLAAPWPETTPLETDTLVRKVGSHVPLRVTMSTLQEPSNGAADADVTAEMVEIARAAVIVTTRKE